MPVDGGAGESITVRGPRALPSSWSLDGNIVTLVSNGKPNGVSVLPIAGERNVQPVLQGGFNLRWPVLSADRRWLAYASDNTGRDEVFVQAYPGAGPKLRLSPDGGTQPVWARNGRELFFTTQPKADNLGTPRLSLMAVDIEGSEGLNPGRPHVLFEGPYVESSPVRNYDVSPDGQRFLMVKPAGDKEPPPTAINLVLNWTEELKRRASAK